MPKIETNSRDEMGIQVKLNRGIQQQEAKRGVTGETAGNSAMRPIVVLLKAAEHLQKHLPACVRFTPAHFCNLSRSQMKVYYVKTRTAFF